MTPKLATTTLAALTAAAALLLPGAGALAAGAQTGGGTAAPAGAGAESAPAIPSSTLATWYGPGLYGRRTACGQTLTRVLVGVANRTLPCGTLVRVGYGSQSLVLPVVDRGPYGHIGAEWDLTAGAAVALGITETVRVATRVVGSTANVPALGLPAGAPAAAGSLAGGAIAG